MSAFAPSLLIQIQKFGLLLTFLRHISLKNHPRFGQAAADTGEQVGGACSWCYL